MDPKFQPSFIPKKADSGLDSFKRPSGTSGGLFYVLGVSLFILALVSATGVFVYEKYLNSRISKMQNDLEVARQALNPELVKDLSRSHARMMSAKEILSKHVSMTSLFSLLSSQTLQAVSFSDFSLMSSSDGSITIEMSGESRDYKTVALQSEIFSKNPYFINPSFSGLDLNESSNVIFNFKSGIAPDFLLYEKAFEASPAVPTPFTPPPSLPEESSEAGSTQSNQVESEQGPINPS